MTENRTAIRLAEDYVTEHQRHADINVFSTPSNSEATSAKLESDVQQFLNLTNKVSRYEILNSPAAKDIFAELKTIAGQWHHQAEFIEKIKNSENRQAILLANDYAKERERSQNQLQSMAFEI